MIEESGVTVVHIQIKINQKTKMASQDYQCLPKTKQGAKIQHVDR